MSPHADSGVSSNNGFRNGSMERGEKTASRKTHNRSHLQATPVTELHDLVCVGFGPASLAIAVALHDSIEDTIKASYRNTSGQSPKVAFLERQSSFAWHSGMLIDGAKMQISFIKDMATLRNPRSEFTFLNYLHTNNRLVEFTNLDTFLPQRVEYEDYMRWCANSFDDVVSYSQEVLQVTPEKQKSGGKVESFLITSRNTATNETTTLRSRHVVIAVGGKPDVPKYFPQNHPKVIHSSQYTHSISKLLTNSRHPYRVAVIGSGQSAAEIFDNLHSRYPNSRTNLLIRGSALKPSDDSPFVNEVFNPSRVDDIYQQDSILRAAAVENNKNTNYGVVRLSLIEKLYETLYTQRIRHSSEHEWPHNILTHRNVTRIENSGAIPGGLRLHVQNRSGDFFANAISNDDEILDVDLVIVATGYRRNMHEEILRDARWLLPASSGSEAQWKPSRDYRVQLDSSVVSSDAGIWLQGCNERTHGLSDTLLSIISIRGGEVVQSIFGKGSNHHSAQKATEIQASNGYNNHALDRLTKQSERLIESHAVQASTGHALGAAARH